MAASKPKGIIAIDIERTGRDQNDVIFAIGIATMPIDAVCLGEVKSFNVCYNLEKKPHKTWADRWAKSGYEERCYVEFWSKHLQTLDLLQDPTKVNLVEEQYLGKGVYTKKFIDTFDNILKEYEELYSESVIVTDTTLFDTVHLGNELIVAGKMPLNYTRAGKFRGGVELDSYITGVARISDIFDWKTYLDFKKNHIKPLMLAQIEQDHHPENDAKNILLMYHAALQYASLHRD